MCGFAWMILTFHWGAWVDHTDSMQEWAKPFVDDEEDGNVLGMQVVVGTIMFLLHLTFEFANYYEMCSVMPRTANHGVWDPREHGIPLKYKLFGLPSMWFTSNEALHDLKHWIDMANPVSKTCEIYPQEIAFYAMKGHDEREHIHAALKEAKLFDGRRRRFVSDDSSGARKGKALDIELCFFDTKLRRIGCKYPGEFLIMGDVDINASKSVHSMRARQQECAQPEFERAKGTSALSFVHSNLRWPWIGNR